MKQQLSPAAVLLWQLIGPSMGHLGARLSGGGVSGREGDESEKKGICEKRPPAPKPVRMERRDGILLPPTERRG